jgi:hypothetical protein
MATKKLYNILIKKYNLEYILKSLLNVNTLDPVLVHSPNGDSIGFKIEGRIVRLYIKSLTDELVLIDESADNIAETYINVQNYQTETIIIKRQCDSLKVIKAERFYVPTDNTISYIEEDHKTYSFDKVKRIYNIPNADLEFSSMRKLLKSFKYIDEDALYEDVREDRHDTLIIYDNKYMKLIDEDIFIKINDQVFKLKYEDNFLDFITSDGIKELRKEMYGR